MEDTRGWKAKGGSNDSTIPGSRTGENRHETTIAQWSPPSGASRTEGPGVPMDNMGNAHGNPGAEQHPTREADNVDVAPSVPLSSYEGVTPSGAGGGIGLDMGSGFIPALHEKEMRSQGKQNPMSSAVIRKGMGGVSMKDKTWKKATIPGGGFENIGADKFTGDGLNAKGVENTMSDEMAKKESGEFQGTVKKRQN